MAGAQVPATRCSARPASWAARIRAGQTRAGRNRAGRDCRCCQHSWTGHATARIARHRVLLGRHQAGELRIQRCGECGALRHPPGPACLSCGAVRNQGYQVAEGTGSVYSYVVHRHPPVPGKQLPIIIALVELTEGPRVMAELTGVDPDEVQIGMPVRTKFIRIDDELVLPGWRPDERAAPGALPEWTLQVTPTVVVSTAIATRDFYPVHHDRDFAERGGSKDIFLNILTTTGLVQRYVTDWAGPQALVRAVSIRLGVPCYAGDTLTFAGRVTDDTGPDGRERVIAVTGSCSLGNHVTGTVRLAAPGSRP